MRCLQANLTGFDEQATLSSTSTAFTQTVLPFSNRMAQRCPSAAPHTASGANTTASSTAGRKLKQVITAPTPQVSNKPCVSAIHQSCSAMRSTASVMNITASSTAGRNLVRRPRPR